jgi:hypothetical protein
MPRPVKTKTPFILPFRKKIKKNESFGKVLFGLAHVSEGLNIALLGKEFT